MNDTVKKIITTLILVVIFIASVTLTIIGQRNVGPAGLGLQLIGVVGLVFLLWNYNRKFK